MGTAILSGVIASLDSKSSPISLPKWDSHGSGTTTPVSPLDESTPGKFIACVSREEGAAKLRKKFVLGSENRVKVVVGRNVEAVKEAEVVLLWLVFRR